jgi:hypothetical protein
MESNGNVNGWINAMVGPVAQAIGSVAARLVRTAVPWIGATKAERDEAKESESASLAESQCGNVGRWVCEAADRCRELVKEQRFSEVVLVAEMALHILDLYGHEPVLEHFARRLEYNLAVAYSALHRWEEARKLLEKVQSSPTSVVPLKAWAGHEMGMIAVEKFKTNSTLNPAQRVELAGAIDAMSDAAAKLPQERSTGLGILTVADIYARCGDWGSAEDAAERANAILSTVPAKKLVDVKKPAERARRWPTLSSRPDWFQRVGPTLFALLFAVCVIAKEHVGF